MQCTDNKVEGLQRETGKFSLLNVIFSLSIFAELNNETPRLGFPRKEAVHVCYLTKPSILVSCAVSFSCLPFLVTQEIFLYVLMLSDLLHELQICIG